MNQRASELPENSRTWLAPLSVFYFLGAYLRMRLFAAGILRSHCLPVPVISVGNLTVGGTGKTPVTIDLARRLIQDGYRPAILSRGYKRRSDKAMVVVSDGHSLLAEPADCGDEPYMMARAVPRAVVIVGADRRKTGHCAVSDYDCDIILLDDGFQHLKVERQLDVVLYDYNDDPEQLTLLPSGRLREPFGGLARANYVVITKVPRTPSPARMAAIKNLIAKHAPEAHITTCQFEPDGVQRIYPRQNVAITTKLTGTRVMAFCGIARPENFFDQLATLGAQPIECTSFPDHHWFSERELRQLKERFFQSGAELMVTTEKDAVRLPEDFINSVPLAQMRLETVWNGSVPLPDFIPVTGTRQLLAVGK